MNKYFDRRGHFARNVVLLFLMIFCVIGASCVCAEEQAQDGPGVPVTGVNIENTKKGLIIPGFACLWLRFLR